MHVIGIDFSFIHFLQHSKISWIGKPESHHAHIAPYPTMPSQKKGYTQVNTPHSRTFYQAIFPVSNDKLERFSRINWNNNDIYNKAFKNMHLISRGKLEQLMTQATLHYPRFQEVGCWQDRRIT